MTRDDRPDSVTTAAKAPTASEWLIVVSAAVVAAAVLSGGPSPIRAVAAFWFLLACPGLSVVRLVRVEDPLAVAGLSLAASVGIDTVLSEVMLYTHTWSPDGALAFLIAFSVAALVAGRWLRRRPVGVHGRAAASPGPC